MKEEAVVPSGVVSQWSVWELMEVSPRKGVDIDR